ncbi:MAG: type VI secretion system tip protein TssI/VgrG [Planctomycetota bacterium]
MPLSAQQREIDCTVEGCQAAFVPVQLSWSEGLGRPFEGAIESVCQEPDLKPTDLLGKGVQVRVGLDEGEFPLHGQIASFRQLECRDSLSRYQWSLTPWIGLLRHSGGSRIYQNQSVPEIFSAVADEKGFSAACQQQLSQTYPQRPYCVQYNESDFDFLHRLLEEEGIFYYFTYDDSGHHLVLCDDVNGFEAASDAGLPYFPSLKEQTEAGVAGWSLESHFTTASQVFGDYDFQQSRVDLSVRQEAEQSPRPWWWYQFPGRFFDSSRGQDLARVRSEATVCQHQSIHLQTNVCQLNVGNQFDLDGHPDGAMEQSYAVIGSRLHVRLPELAATTGQSSSVEWHREISVQALDLPFRPRQQTARPTAPGTQIATVVGPAGEEIWTDQYGRVKIKFAWDRNPDSDDTVSCWVRVAQAWTGRGWGMMSVPRVGEEVIVAFFHGDVDRPIIVGRIPNDAFMPPEKLADGQAKTVLRTRSTPGGDASTFHELSFDDTAGQEQIFLHSQRDFVREVKNNDALKVGFDTQDPGDQTIEVFHNQSTDVGGDISQQAGGDMKHQVGGDATINSDGQITIQAATGLKLVCGGSTIELTPDQITIKGTMVAIN